MGTDPIIAPLSDTHRYEAVVRISEAIAACREPEELATLSRTKSASFLNFDHQYFVVFEGEHQGNRIPSVGQEPNPFGGPADGRAADVGRDQQPKPAAYS